MQITTRATAIAAAGGVTMGACGLGAVATGALAPDGMAGPMAVLMALLGLALAAVALTRLVVVGSGTTVNLVSRRRMRRNPPTPIARAVIQRLTTEWPSIRLSSDVKGRISETVATFPDEAALSIMPRIRMDEAHDGLTVSQYLNDETDVVSAGSTINEMRRLAPRDAEHVALHFRTLQRRGLATALGLADDDMDVIEQAIAAIVQADGLLQVDTGRRAADFEVKERANRRLPSTPVTLTMVRMTGRGQYGRCMYAVGPGFGAVRIRVDPVIAAFERNAQLRLASAFRSDDRPVGMLPTFVGNARAARLAQLARQALAMDPDLTDASGAYVRPLIEEHLPLLVERHRKASLTAETRDMAAVDADLDRGLDEAARAIGQALEKVRSKARDDLRDQVRFLETRNAGTSNDAL